MDILLVFLQSSFDKETQFPANQQSRSGKIGAGTGNSGLSFLNFFTNPPVQPVFMCKLYFKINFHHTTVIFNYFFFF